MRRMAASARALRLGLIAVLLFVGSAIQPAAAAAQTIDVDPVARPGVAVAEGPGGLGDGYYTATFRSAFSSQRINPGDPFTYTANTVNHDGFDWAPSCGQPYPNNEQYAFPFRRVGPGENWWTAQNPEPVSITGLHTVTECYRSGEWEYDTRHVVAGADTLGLTPGCYQGTNWQNGIVFPGSSTTTGTIAVLEVGDADCSTSLQVRKALEPANDPGRFDLLIDGKVERVSAGHTDGTGAIPVHPGEHTVGEIAAADSPVALSSYANEISCIDLDNDSLVIASGQNTPTLELQVALGHDVQCTVRNIARRTFTWSMPERYNGSDRDGNGLADYFTPLNYDAFPPAPDYSALVPTKWRVEVVADPCLSDVAYSWQVDGVVLAHGCTAPLYLEERPYNVSLLANGAAVDTKPVEPKDWLIAAIGDSYGSGEGNPDVPKRARRGRPDIPSRWQDKQCHRSKFASSALAAERVEKADPHSSVTLLHYSCSGATIPFGLVGSYDGAAPDADKAFPKPNQVGELARALSFRPIDALLVSIGGNDIGFAKIIEKCLIFLSCDKKKKQSCLPTRVWNPRVVGRLARTVLSRLNTKTRCGASARKVFESGIKKFAGRYNHLATAIATLPVEPSHVIVTGYPDITRGSNGKFCGTGKNSRILSDALPQVIGHLPKISFVAKLALKGWVKSAQADGYLKIDGKETEWAGDEVLLGLNRELKSIAERYGWTYVDGHVSANAKHGYCSRDPWVRRWTEAKSLQEAVLGGVGPSPGAVHPNVKGHVSYRDAILPELQKLTMPTG